MSPHRPPEGSLPRPELDRIARRALREDRIDRDRTTEALGIGPVRARASVVAQAEGTLAGIPVALAVARAVHLKAQTLRSDGSRVRAGTEVLRLSGDARAILGAERTVLNFLMHLSGVATATARAVRASGPDGPRIYATRKTTPGLRDLEKSAVVAGGGSPHRRDLSDAVLLKNNHLALLPLVEAVERAVGHARGRWPVQVEVRSAAEAVAAARAGASALLIDNAGPRPATTIVRALERAGLRTGRWVELSGGIRPETVRSFRSVGADALSLGALTHSSPALPFHLLVRPVERAPRPR